MAQSGTVTVNANGQPVSVGTAVSAQSVGVFSANGPCPVLVNGALVGSEPLVLVIPASSQVTASATLASAANSPTSSTLSYYIGSLT